MQVSMEGNKRRVMYALGVQLVLGFAFLITAIVASSACLLVDATTGSCVTGPSHAFFAITRGETFQIGLAAILFMGHTLWALSLLRRGTSSVNLGALLGSSVMITLFAISVSAVWGSVSSSLSNMDCNSPDALPRPNSNVVLKCNGYSSTVSALSVISSLIFLLQAAITAMMYMWQAEFVGFESTGDIYESIATSSSPRSRHPFEPLPQANDEESSAMTGSMSQSVA